jgi:hypothetical protein
VPTPTRSLRLSAVLLAAVLAVGTLIAAAPAGAATAAPQVAAAGSHDLDLSGDAHVSTTSGHRASYAWSGRTIRYYETIPSRWDWSLTTAVSKWNAAGGGIRFVRTSIRSHAQLTIGFGNVGNAAGRATVGRTRNAWLRVNPIYRDADEFNAHNRVEVMAIFTHELGHVLGFQHTAGRCSTMAAMLDVDGCGVVSPARPGYYRCRTIDSTLLTRFVRLYGGRARSTSASQCLIDPMPSALPQVAVDAGSEAPTTIRWAKPTTVPAGSRVSIQHWSADSCADVPTASGTDYSAPTSSMWQEQDAESQDNCFRVQLVNRYGVGRPPVVTMLQRAVLAGPADVPATP